MGHSSWSDAAFQARQRHRTATRSSAFVYDDQVRRSGVVQAHPEMDPLGKVRESRDSQAHPASVAIGVLFDVTGSMGEVPRVLQTKLGALMRLLVQRGCLDHPQILFGAIGDAYSDRVPLQIGQFESGLEMDDDLGKIFIEGGGGGQTHESYELGFYFMARHTVIDCFEQRGHKGYLFTIGDEKPYPVVSRSQVAAIIGDRLEADLPLEQALAELHARYEHFHIMPTETHHGRSADVQGRWRELLGERVLLLEDAGAVCETIALAVGLCEGTLPDLGDARADLVAAGYDPAAAGAAATALAPFAAARPAAPRLAVGLLPGA